MGNLKTESEIIQLMREWSEGNRIDWNQLNETQSQKIRHILQIIPDVTYAASREAIEEYFHVACAVDYSDNEQVDQLGMTEEQLIGQLAETRQLLGNNGETSFNQERSAGVVVGYLGLLADTTRTH